MEIIERVIYNRSIGSDVPPRWVGIIVHPMMCWRMLEEGCPFFNLEKMEYRGLRVLRSGDLGKDEVIVF